MSNALHMAVAEGAYSSDRLSHLKTVASGLKPLIYDLKAGSDLAIFEKCCSEVWKAIEADTSLTTYLVCIIIVASSPGLPLGGENG